MMKIAYIVTAYIDAPQLRRLVDSLTLNSGDGEADFYIHVDQKIAVQPFYEALTDCKSKVFWCKNRYRINWGGYNQVKSQYELLRMIFEETTRKYDRIVCLSATDYPLWSNHRIVNFFSQNSKTEFIGGFNLTRSSDERQLRKIKDYHFFRDIKLPLKLKRVICGGTRFLLHYSPFHKPIVCKTDSGCNYEVYTGSDYWALTYQCAKYVFGIMKEDKSLVRYFKWSYIPSEAVINTIVLNSPYRNSCVTPVEQQEYPGLEILTPLHHLQYNGAIKVYTIDDWNELKDSNKMFFRKARSGYSDKLIEKIEKTFRS